MVEKYFFWNSYRIKLNLKLKLGNILKIYKIKKLN